MRIILGSTNPGKLIEIRKALSGLNVELIGPKDLGITEYPVEHGDTFQANALEKARFYFERSKLPTLADDSGIIVEALQNELGVHTRRWGAGADASDSEWIQFFLERMRHEKNKRAAFICVLAYLDATGKEYFFEGRCEGKITDKLEADYLSGLPISGCFKPNGFSVVYSAMNIEQKNSTSHRGKATLALKEYLIKII